MDADEDFRRRAEELREDRRLRARELRDEGLSVRAIADRLGVSHPTIIEDLRDPSAAAAFDAMVKQSLDRNRIDVTMTGAEVDAVLRQAKVKPQEQIAEREPTTAEQMDAWLRSPAARRGATLTGAGPADDYLHQLYADAESSRRHRAAINLSEGEQ